MEVLRRIFCCICLPCRKDEIDDFPVNRFPIEDDGGMVTESKKVQSELKPMVQVKDVNNVDSHVDRPEKSAEQQTHLQQMQTVAVYHSDYSQKRELEGRFAKRDKKITVRCNLSIVEALQMLYLINGCRYLDYSTIQKEMFRIFGNPNPLATLYISFTIKMEDEHFVVLNVLQEFDSLAGRQAKSVCSAEQQPALKVLQNKSSRRQKNYLDYSKIEKQLEIIFGRPKPVIQPQTVAAYNAEHFTPNREIESTCRNEENKIIVRPNQSSVEQPQTVAAYNAEHFTPNREIESTCGNEENKIIVRPNQSSVEIKREEEPSVEPKKIQEVDSQAEKQTKSVCSAEQQKSLKQSQTVADCNAEHLTPSREIESICGSEEHKIIERPNQSSEEVTGTQPSGSSVELAAGSTTSPGCRAPRDAASYR